MLGEKARGEVPMVMYEPHRQEPSAPQFCGQDGGYEFPSPPPYSCRETTTIEEPASNHCGRDLLQQTNIHNLSFLPPAHHHPGHLQTGQAVLPPVHKPVHGWVLLWMLLRTSLCEGLQGCRPLLPVLPVSHL
ncbi:LITAF domain-containing protein isoform X2 [Corvus kubaryi]|uniref:LITAF domain-containing protein isoform X2 n=1 Tax=Corvus kubaryi TaxID=68294 RepID=UPI001C044F47|nr:LITAF domain-containing protein isoform X2 [Corvus kubaryi]